MKRMISILIALSITIGYMTLPAAAANSPTAEQQIMAEETDEPVRSPVVEIVVIEEVPEPVLLSLAEIVKEVKQGKWGNGQERKTALEQTGYDYEVIQAEIDKEKPKPAVSLPTGEYPEARLIWNTIVSWGWSAETAAGIIGNMMAEIGGGTLNLSRWNSDKGCGYGLIQWTSGRANGIKARYGVYPNIEQQLQYMKDELLGTNGVRAQVTAAQLKQILNGSPESTALAFASYFERCGKVYRARRQGYARIAYEYFTQGE